jgi:hypothetical protein
MSFNTQHFAMANMVLVGVWILIAFWTGRENAQLTGEAKEKGAAMGREAKATAS